MQETRGLKFVLELRRGPTPKPFAFTCGIEDNICYLVPAMTMEFLLRVGRSKLLLSHLLSGNAFSNWKYFGVKRCFNFPMLISFNKDFFKGI